MLIALVHVAHRWKKKYVSVSEAEIEEVSNCAVPSGVVIELTEGFDAY